ncbi:unnamed protein product [Arctia plantaginis]|uniref:Uncharacterized protein n=1 Tax=Arctia plantaginis TaxID=874455 RepID=A0A8S0Z8B8_ARCPL|nr:unnamed protein product [Arctia plantaginis]
MIHKSGHISISKQRGVARCPPRKHFTLRGPTRAPPRALHQNDDGNPILPTSGTEARFYKLRDLCQYCTRIRRTHRELQFFGYIRAHPLAWRRNSKLY